MLTSIDLPEHLFRKFCTIVYEMAGISLNDSKRELVRSRLLKRIRKLGLTSFQAYYDYVTAEGGSGEELVRMIDVISTNKTDFFRENQHFDFLAQSVLPALVQRCANTGNRRIRIWSAGCSSGEEPYTLAIVVRNTLRPNEVNDTKILATDISTDVLNRAYRGLYEQPKLAPVPGGIRGNAFTKVMHNGTTYYEVRPEVKSMITFRRLNLMRKTFPFSGKFDVIFCRNVMIYFDKQTQEELVNKFYQYTQPGGYLFIGHSESLNSLSTPYQFVRPTIYLKQR